MSIVNEVFKRVMFDDADIVLHRDLYIEVEGIASKMDKAAPDGAPKTLAIRALKLALMHFGDALAHQEKYKD